MEKMWLTQHWSTWVLFSHIIVLLWISSEISNSGFSERCWRRRLPGCYVLSTTTVTDISKKRCAYIISINPADGRTTPIRNAGICLPVDKTRPNVPKDVDLYHEYGGNIQTASNTIAYSGLKNLILFMIVCCTIKSISCSGGSWNFLVVGLG
jgi:hypothetical protein